MKYDMLGRPISDNSPLAGGNDNWFQKPAFNNTGGGNVCGLSGTPVHASLPNNGQDHLTFDQPFNNHGWRRDFSLETSLNLNGLNQQAPGSLEARTQFLNSFYNSPFKK